MNPLNGVFSNLQHPPLIITPIKFYSNFQFNRCSGTAGEGSIAGICVVSKDIIIDPFPGEEHSKVSHPNFTPVKGVTIKGFEIHGFSGQNIVLYGAKDASISNNKLIDGGSYGFLTVASKNTDVRGNTITSSSLFSLIGPSIGACSDNYYGATVWANDFDGYGISICVQTNGANIQHNHITNSCLSIFVDPGIEGAIIRHNKISSANPICAPAIGVITGISLAGASKTQVEHNDITGQTAGDAAPPGFKGNGISIFDWPEGQAIPAAYNEIFRNDLSYNDQDLALLTAAPGNVFKKNDCVSSTPPGLCSL